MMMIVVVSPQKRLNKMMSETQGTLNTLIKHSKLSVNGG